MADELPEDATSDDIQRRFREFLVQDMHDNPQWKRVERMLTLKSQRVILNINDLRRVDRDLAEKYVRFQSLNARHGDGEGYAPLLLD